ncbi:MAG: hypothetical protein HZY75_12780 [Nocardioidaceae bacterium]|nr:MAG: hypothetical protein HZY75_12780 [Nocardioidaceae bacterium]
MRGKKGTLPGRVLTRAVLAGYNGKVTVSWKGEVIARTKIGNQGRFSVKIGTKRFKAGKTYKVKVKFQGAGQAAKSATLPVKLKVR